VVVVVVAVAAGVAGVAVAVASAASTVEGPGLLLLAMSRIFSAAFSSRVSFLPEAFMWRFTAVATAAATAGSKPASAWVMYFAACRRTRFMLDPIVHHAATAAVVLRSTNLASWCG
jgi:hypothetical protein